MRVNVHTGEKPYNYEHGTGGKSEKSSAQTFWEINTKRMTFY